MTRSRRRRRAFSLLELMLVMVIIGLLAGVAAINLVGTADKARRNATETSMKVIETALKNFYFENGAYPTSTDGLQLLVQSKHLESLPLDGYKRPFQYFSPASNGAPFEIVSAGKDALFETEDDLILVARIDG